jgi:hypothetical protein
VRAMRNVIMPHMAGLASNDACRHAAILSLSE